MTATEYVRRVSDHPLGRVVVLLLGVAGVYGILTVSPPIRPLVWWAFPVLLVLWGATRLYRHGFDSPLTVIAAGLLLLGGVSRGVYQLVPMDEFAGTVANLIPLFGIIAVLFDQHYRDHE